jgi:hypothetical protein
MPETIPCGVVLCALLIAGVFFAGCSGEQPAAITPVPTTLPLAKYAAGDIITRSGTDTDYYLILGYDRATDQYERAWVYRNPDGGFGYRTDNRSDRSSRVTLEKTYPVRVSFVSVSSVPVATPTTPAAAVVPGTAPSIETISPEAGSKDSTVGVTITGSHFREGTTVKLLKPGYPPIKATAVSVQSGTSIDCTFNLEGFDKGTLNVVVTNPDGQSDTLINGFKIGAAGPIVTSVSPGTVLPGTTRNLMIYGQNFQDPFKVTFKKARGVLECTNPRFQDATKIFCDLEVPAGIDNGDWTLTVINVADQTAGSYPRPYVIANTS